MLSDMPGNAGVGEGSSESEQLHFGRRGGNGGGMDGLRKDGLRSMPEACFSNSSTCCRTLVVAADGGDVATSPVPPAEDFRGGIGGGGFLRPLPDTSL